MIHGLSQGRTGLDAVLLGEDYVNEQRKRYDRTRYFEQEITRGIR